MDELIKQLRDYAKWAEKRPLEIPILLPVYLRQAADELEKRRWIPVEERLPEDREMVIGFTPCDGFMFVGYHIFSCWNIVTAMRSTKNMTKKVTNWMPLPAPPKEESNGNQC